MSIQLNRRRLIKGLMLSPLAALPQLLFSKPFEQKWQSGGTDLISVPYPDDSIFTRGNTCKVNLTRATTAGPCYFQDNTGEDISLGLSGLPMQLCLRVVDSNCEPLPDHVVQVWHCDTRGVYSGDTSESTYSRRYFASRFCTSGDKAAAKSTWYRGMLTTNNTGRVNFKTCFPGWYPGQTIHIHFAVSNKVGETAVVSQLCFSDEIAHDICTNHELYKVRGGQDVPLSSGNDVVFPSHSYEDFIATTKRNIDGTLLAYHTIQVE